jgi:hypothetical protein
MRSPWTMVVGTHTGLVDEENSLVETETRMEDARSSVFSAAAALALAAGIITTANKSRL